MEFPYIGKLISENQFDAIYHEHFRYFSFSVVQDIFHNNGLHIFDVEELPTHGGSLRIFAQHDEFQGREVNAAVAQLVRQEHQDGLRSMEKYLGFKVRVEEIKKQLLAFLISARNRGKQVAGYDAPGKGNTQLNYCGITTDLLKYTVDRNPYKQGAYTPGTHIPVFAPQKTEETRPDYILILPWNLKAEIMETNAIARTWGCKFVTPIPEVTVHE